MIRQINYSQCLHAMPRDLNSPRHSLDTSNYYGGQLAGMGPHGVVPLTSNNIDHVHPVGIFMRCMEEDMEYTDGRALIAMGINTAELHSGRSKHMYEDVFPVVTSDSWQNGDYAYIDEKGFWCRAPNNRCVIPYGLVLDISRLAIQNPSLVLQINPSGYYDHLDLSTRCNCNNNK